MFKQNVKFLFLCMVFVFALCILFETSHAVELSKPEGPGFKTEVYDKTREEEYGIDKIKCDNDNNGFINMKFDYIYNSTEDKYVRLNMNDTSDNGINQVFKYCYNQDDKKNKVEGDANFTGTFDKDFTFDYFYDSSTGLVKYKNATMERTSIYYLTKYEHDQSDRLRKETTKIHNATVNLPYSTTSVVKYTKYDGELLKERQRDSNYNGIFEPDMIITNYYDATLDDRLDKKEFNDTSTNNIDSYIKFNYNSSTGRLANYTFYNASNDEIYSVCYTDWRYIGADSDDDSTNGGDETSSDGSGGGGGGCTMHPETTFGLSWLLLFVVPVFLTIRRKT